MRNLDEYRDWQGSIDELVEMANVALQRLGRGRNADLNIRLVRDYAQRGILSPAERRGKEAVYRFQHLNEIIAARAKASAERKAQQARTQEVRPERGKIR